jgi:hypothetical protein
MRGVRVGIAAVEFCPAFVVKSATQLETMRHETTKVRRKCPEIRAQPRVLSKTAGPPVRNVQKCQKSDGEAANERAKR